MNAWIVFVLCQACFFAGFVTSALLSMTSDRPNKSSTAGKS